ncbi:ABC transporter permease [Solibacillus sp. MA9]|uniref:ABC transporter permease n=1 Tax=Solibacillus palustris TaxID=2908203 RepID=A0ABS9UBR3_9BACL|nr:ABC transporter permease [Solibacillus sp. MA9]
MRVLSKFNVLVKKLYKQKVRSKSFILMTLLYLVVLTGVMFWSEIKEMLFSGDADVIAVVNKTDFDVSQVLQNTDDYTFEYVAADAVADNLKNEDYYAAFTLTDASGKLAAKIESYDPLPLNDQQEYQNMLNQVGQMYAMSQVDLSPEQQELLLSSEPVITLNSLNEAAEDGKSADEKMAGVWISYAIGIIIYAFVATYLSMITTDVASEKGSRALEMLLVSVKPEIHFRSKIFGTFLVALTQFVVLFGVLLLLLRFTDGGNKWSFVTDLLDSLSVSYFMYVVGFLFLTILMYLIIGALFGSLVSKVEEGGQVMMPAMMLTLIGFYVMLSGMGNPDTMLIKVFSYIPFTSGMVMPMRLGATDINAIEPIISFGLLVGTVLALYFVSLSFYKRSVLTYSAGGIIEKMKTVFKVTT